jgi:type VI protein secretion system component Hcp
VIHACVSTQRSGIPNTGANIRIIDSDAGQTCNPAGAASAETALNWNATGPQGPPGAPGASGSPGAPGKVVTVAGGHTLTIGGQVITVASDPGVTITPPPLRGNAPSVGTVQIGSGPDAVTFNVLDFSFASPATANASSRRVQVKDISITKRVDKSSAKLFQACATGKHFQGAKLTVRKASGKIYLVFRFKLVAVKTISWASRTGGGTPLQAITLSFSQESIENS